MLRKFVAICLFLWCARADAEGAAFAMTPEASNNPHLARILGNPAVPHGLGINVHPGEGLAAARDFELVQRLGLSLIRADFLWSEIERETGRYDWHRYDTIVSQSRAHGITPLFILDYANPLYVTKGGEGSVGQPSPAPISDAAQTAFGRFAAAAAARYRGLALWELWNEPNINFGQPIDLDAYIRFAGVVCKAMRHADPDAAIIGPASSEFAFSFLRDFIASDRDHCFDAVSVHPYRDGDPETVLEDWERLRAMSPGFVLANSEWGYSSIGGEWTLERQAEYVARLYLVDLLAGVPITMIYDARNDSLSGTDLQANFGLTNFWGRPKPAGQRLAALVSSLNKLELLGRVRSPKADFLLLFGAGNQKKIAAWTTRSADIHVTLDSRLCIAAVGSRSAGADVAKCDDTDQVLQIEPISLMLTGQPIVVTIRDRRP